MGNIKKIGFPASRNAIALGMIPVLNVMFAWLAHRKERESIEEFGDAYREYAMRAPRIIPKLKSLVKRGAI